MNSLSPGPENIRLVGFGDKMDQTPNIKRKYKTLEEMIKLLVNHGQTKGLQALSFEFVWHGDNKGQRHDKLLVQSGRP